VSVSEQQPTDQQVDAAIESLLQAAAENAPWFFHAQDILYELLAKARKWDLICEAAKGRGVDPFELPAYIADTEEEYRYLYESAPAGG
jgi:hypothetical protein